MQRYRKVLACVLLGWAAICMRPTHVRAQAVYGSIYGQVTDPSGASIPNATVTVTDVAKGTSVQVTTNQSGEYLVPHLIPDVYNVKASAPGFQPIIDGQLPLV